MEFFTLVINERTDGSYHETAKGTIYYSQSDLEVGRIPERKGRKVAQIGTIDNLPHTQFQPKKNQLNLDLDGIAEAKAHADKIRKDLQS